MLIEMRDESAQVSESLLKQTEKLLKFAADYIGLSASKEMSVSFIENVRSREINREFRNKDRPTDVISLEYKPDEILFDASFPEGLTEELDPFIGEIYINIERAKEQAQDYGHSLAREYGWLAVHGFLHINGYDHGTPDEEKEMFNLQEEILTAYGLRR